MDASLVFGYITVQEVIAQKVNEFTRDCIQS